MKRKESLIEQRRKYIRSRVEKVKHRTSEIKRISKELFISVDTIYRDLRD